MSILASDISTGKCADITKRPRLSITNLLWTRKNAQALAYLGDIELKRENSEKALLLLNRAVGLREDIRIAQMDIGVILTQQKRYQEALYALQRAEKLDPEQPEVHYRLGRLLQAMAIHNRTKRFARVQQLHKKRRTMSSDKMSSLKLGPTTK